MFNIEFLPINKYTCVCVRQLFTPVSDKTSYVERERERNMLSHPTYYFGWRHPSPCRNLYSVLSVFFEHFPLYLLSNIFTVPQTNERRERKTHFLTSLQPTIFYLFFSRVKKLLFYFAKLSEIVLSLSAFFLSKKQEIEKRYEI